MKNLSRRLLFIAGCLGLYGCSLYVVSRIWKPTRLLKSEQSASKIPDSDDSVSSMIQSAFNRDALLEDFFIGQLKFSFNNIKGVELLTTNASIGIQLLVDDPSNFIRYLRSPKSVSDLIPALVCDIVFFCVSYGSAGKYSTLLKWREAYIKQHPGACLLLFSNDDTGLSKDWKFTFKPLNHLFLIKAISDGRIITTARHGELLESGLISSAISSPGRPRLNSVDENSVKEFIRLLTPHMSSGIGIPSNADMSQYPIMIFLDLDTLFTNKSITVPKFLERIDEGLKLQPVLPSLKNETLSNDPNGAPSSSSAVDFVIATDVACDNAPVSTVNSGVLLSRPSSKVADLFLFAVHNRFESGIGRGEDQGSVTRELQLMSDYNASHLMVECAGRSPRWLWPEYQNRIVLASVLSDSTDPADLALAKRTADDSRQRNEYMESIWGPPVESRNVTRVPLVVVVNERWCNAMFRFPKHTNWHPGDWIVHFTGFKHERKLGREVREWICNNLDSVAHPDDWPSSPNDCPYLVQKGFNPVAPSHSGRRKGKRNKKI